ncbi:hypothetical protein J5J86_05835 [Aquabacter sp. L1I39]|uniref:glycosyltransferase n=1 Tax=Aquabacter sp. L1I39 TaxID=2820278 RepID=UPI001ADD04CE|nr:glycosyltransferase [Aquabacter sp. L1I39]QTL04838.1 hypothetical protein J5J86_05835 [Aquabacter sp. L1I39]
MTYAPQIAADAAPHLETSPELPWADFHQADAGAFAGYAFVPSDPTRKLAVELLVDGVPAAVCLADLHHPRLAEAGIGDGCHGFRFTLGADVLAGAARISARLANTDVALPLSEPSEGAALAAPGEAGAVEWLGGLRFRGWLKATSDTPFVLVTVDGEDVCEIAADLWTVAQADGSLLPARGFDFTLPDVFADGVAHLARFSIRNQAIGQGAVAFLAFPDSLRQALDRLSVPASEALRADLFDRMLPRSIPFERYEAWREAQAADLPAFPAESSPIGIVLLGELNLEDSLNTLSREPEGWIVGVVPSDMAQAEFDPASVADFARAEAQECQSFLFLPSGSRIHAGTLARIALAFEAHPDANLIHLDLDVEGADGRRWPLALPAGDYERLLEQGYPARAFAIRRLALETSLRRGARNIFRLVNAVYDSHPHAAAPPLHLSGACVTVPGPLLREGEKSLRAATQDHLRSLRVEASCLPASGSALPAVRVARAPEPGRVSVVVNAMAAPDLVSRSLASLIPAIRRLSGELILMLDPARPVPVLPMGFRQVPCVHLSRAAAINAGLRAAQGDILVHVDAGVVSQDGAWLDEVLGRLSAPGVGAAAGLLRDPDGGVMDAGYVLGPKFDALPAFQDRVGRDPGYGDLLQVAHEVGALSWRFIALRAHAFNALEGLDEQHFPSFLFDVDFSLRLRALGRRLILTPHARTSVESGGGGPRGALQRERRDRELRALRARWGMELSDDPYYSPLMTQDGVPYSALAWPPAPPALRRAARPDGGALPVGL